MSTFEHIADAALTRTTGTLDHATFAYVSDGGTRAHEEVTGALAALAVAQTAEAYAAAHPLLASSPEDGGE